MGCYLAKSDKSVSNANNRCHRKRNGRMKLTDNPQDGKPLAFRSQKATEWTIGIAIFCFVFLVKFLQHNSFHTNAFDLSLYDTAIRNTLSGNFLFSDQLGRNLFSEHYSPILLIFVPFYQLYDSVLWFFIAQALCVSAVFYLSVRIALHYGISFGHSIFLGLFCALNKRLAEGVLYNFHPEIFAVPLVMLLIFAYLKKRLLLLYLASVILLSVKEDMALSLLGFSLLVSLISNKMRKHLIFISIASIALFCFAVFLLIPAQMPSPGLHSRFITERWGNFGSTPLEVGIGLLLSPAFLLKSIANAYLKLVESVGFLAFFSPVELLAALPYISLHSTSSFELESNLKLYYSFGAISFMFWAMILTYKKGLRVFSFRKYLPLIICLIILLTQWRWRVYIPNSNTQELHKLINDIPTNANISAQSPIVPHLQRFKQARVFPEQTGVSYEESTHVILNEKLDIYPLQKDKFNEAIVKLTTSKLWNTSYAHDGIYLFVRVHPSS